MICRIIPVPMIPILPPRLRPCLKPTTNYAQLFGSGPRTSSTSAANRILMKFFFLYPLCMCRYFQFRAACSTTESTPAIEHLLKTGSRNRSTVAAIVPQTAIRRAFPAAYCVFECMWSNGYRNSALCALCDWAVIWISTLEKSVITQTNTVATKWIEKCLKIKCHSMVEREALEVWKLERSRWSWKTSGFVRQIPTRGSDQSVKPDATDGYLLGNQCEWSLSVSFGE